MYWIEGEPEKSGYYLVAWKKANNQIVVSELWFNPDAIFHWWFTRGYIGQFVHNGIKDALRKEIVAWMPMPDPPKEQNGSS